MKTSRLGSWKKIVWTTGMLNFLKENYTILDNQELADHLGLKLTSVRTKLYELGCKRMEMEYWTPEQVSFLKNNFRAIGDLELSEIFASKWPKGKGWSKKHIEKKRRYLNLKRSEAEKKNIHARNKAAGRFASCPVNRWIQQGVFPEGQIRFWKTMGNRLVPFIKVNGRFIHWAPYVWKINFGPIPKNMNVVFMNDNPTDMRIDNLELLTNGQLSFRNSQKSSIGLSDNYIAGMLSHNDPELRKFVKRFPDILEAKRIQLKLDRKIKQYEKQNHRPQRSHVCGPGKTWK
jgi:hypothetical protein